MKKILSIYITLFLLLTCSVFAASESTTQYQKQYLSPFYRNNMTSGVQYNSSLQFNPPDGVSSVSSAVISYDVWITPTVTFNLLVNGRTCNNPSYTVSTTFAGSGRGVITFDCTNVITNKGNYTMSLTPIGANTGASTAYADISYQNKPRADINMFGTEYTPSTDGKVWVQVVDANLQEIENATCYVSIYRPDNIPFITNEKMQHLTRGIYYTNFLVPAFNGVYPAVSNCYYITADANFTLANYAITTGSLNAGTLSSAQVDDASYLKIDEALIGSNWHVSFNGTFNVSDRAALINGVSIVWIGKWNGQVNDNLIMYFYNFTSGIWQALPNPGVPQAGAEFFFSNLIGSTNLSRDGVVNNQSMLYVQMNDSNIADGTKSQVQTNFLSLSITSLNTSNAVEVKGSSELHVTGTPAGHTDVFVEDLCAQQNIMTSGENGECAVPLPDTEFNYKEGILVDNVTITPLSGIAQDTEWTYLTPFNQDCTSLYHVYLLSGNMVVSDLLENLSTTIGSKENCEIRIPISLNGSFEPFHYQFIYDNYDRWEMDWIHDQLLDVRNYLTPICSLLASQANYSYDIPITTSTNTSINSTLLYCLRAYDDLFYFDSYYNASINSTVQSGLESDVIEARLYRDSIYREHLHFQHLRDEQDTTHDDILHNLTSVENQLANMPQSIWTYASRNLTFTPDLTNYTLITYNVWNATNGTRTLTFYPAELDLTNYTLLQEYVWNHSNRSLTYIPDMTNYTLIQVRVWNASDGSRNLTYFPGQVDLTNYPLIATTVWSSGTRTLTSTQDVTDYAYIAYLLYNNTNQTMQSLDFTLLANHVWNSTNRTLTLYPADVDVDLTNYTRVSESVWQYQDTINGSIVQQLTSTVNINLTGNLSVINESLAAGFATLDTSIKAPRSIDFNTLLIIIFAALLLVSLFVRGGGLWIITAFVGVIVGIIYMSTVAFWLGLIIAAVGAVCFVIGYSKLQS